MISRGKGYRSPVVALENPEESRMSGKASVDLPTDPYAPIKKGIWLCSADLRELAEVERTPQASGSKDIEGSPTKQARGLLSPEGTLRRKRVKSKEGWSGPKGVSAPVETEEESEELEDKDEWSDNIGIDEIYISRSQIVIKIDRFLGFFTSDLFNWVKHEAFEDIFDEILREDSDSYANVRWVPMFLLRQYFHNPSIKLDISPYSVFSSNRGLLQLDIHFVHQFRLEAEAIEFDFGSCSVGEELVEKRGIRDVRVASSGGVRVGMRCWKL
jgi:hypothetical protein